jgi:hypothetical protein
MLKTRSFRRMSLSSSDAKNVRLVLLRDDKRVRRGPTAAVFADAHSARALQRGLLANSALQPKRTSRIFLRGDLCYGGGHIDHRQHTGGSDRHDKDSSAKEKDKGGRTGGRARRPEFVAAVVRLEAKWRARLGSRTQGRRVERRPPGRRRYRSRYGRRARREFRVARCGQGLTQRQRGQAVRPSALMASGGDDLRGGMRGAAARPRAHRLRPPGWRRPSRRSHRP